MLDVLCLALWTAGTIPDGNLRFEVQVDNINTVMYTQEQKINFRRVLCDEKIRI